MAIPIVFIALARSGFEELRCRYLEFELAQCFAEFRLMGNGAFVSPECQRRIEAGNILREKFAANFSRFFSTKSSRFPSNFDDKIGVVSSCDEYIPDCSFADGRSVIEDVDIEVWNLRRVFCRIGKVDTCLEIERGLASAEDYGVVDLRLELREATTCRDRCNLVSFGAGGRAGKK